MRNKTIKYTVGEIGRMRVVEDFHSGQVDAKWRKNVVVAKKPKLDLDWLVKNRSRIQELALKLYKLASKMSPTQREKYAVELVYLISTTFSLWRSVFLSAKKRTGDEMIAAGLDMLEIVIETNAIGFAQDRNAHQWAAGYYNASAMYRLEHFKKRINGIASFKKIISVRQRQVLEEFSFDTVILLESAPNKLWEKVCEMLEVSIDILRQVVEKK